MIKSLLNNKLIIVLILLIHTINYSNAKEAEKVEFYTNKEIASKTRLFSYPVKYKISEDTAKKTKIYYKIYKSVSNMVVREDFYYNNVLISHYMFYYKDKLTDKEEYYDNLILVEYRKFIYNTKGKIERIESYDPKNFRSGDWYYFDAKNNIEKIARYRDNKLSFLKLFEKSKLSETHYYNRLFTKITKYNTKGVAISEKNINKDEENKITVKEDLNPLLSFKVEDINKIVFHSNKNNITLTKKRGKWTLKLDKTSYEASDEAVNNYLNLVKELLSFKIFIGKTLSKKSYGLVDSKSTLSIWDNKNKEMKITVGDYANTENAYYVSVNNSKNEIKLVYKEEIEQITNIKPYDFRVREIIRAKTNSIKSLSINKLTFYKKRNTWLIKSYINMDESKIEETVNAILNLKAIDFIDDPVEKKRLSNIKPKHIITVHSATKTYKLFLITDDNKVYIKTNFPETIYQTSTDILKIINLKIKDYKTKD